MFRKLSKKLGIQNAIDQVKEAQMSVLHVQSNALFKLLMEDNYDSSSYEDDESENVDTPQVGRFLFFVVVTYFIFNFGACYILFFHMM